MKTRVIGGIKFGDHAYEFHAKFFHYTVPPLGVMPTRTLTVFVFLYAVKVVACDNNDEGRSTLNSMASIITLVLGYSVLKASGMYFFYMPWWETFNCL